MLKQTLQQRLSQKLSPQQIQFIKLLQVPTAFLEARIQQELEENPALEDGNFLVAEHEDEYSSMDEEATHNEIESSNETEVKEEFDIDEYLKDDNEDYFKSVGDNNMDDDEKQEMPIGISLTFHDQLEMQLSTSILNDKDYVIAKQIIGSIDNDGYLRRQISSLVDDLAFSQNIIAEPHEVEHVLELIQQFDPAGVGAKDLQECLLLQLKRKDLHNPIILLAIEIVEKQLEEFTKKHYDKIEQHLNVPTEKLKEAISEILRLNPKPGDSFADVIATKVMHVIPDFIINKENEILKLSLNSLNAPELRISREYRDMLEHYDKSSKEDKKMKEAVQFVKQKLDGAKWFIDAIRQRQQTLLKTMNAILEYQYEYFLDGDERKLKPMILQDIADKINMDLSTVSRVANSKYVQTEFGTFLLKSFFSEGLTTDSGEEVSSKEVKKILEDCIGSEDKHKPLADEKLADILNEKGYNIARRTIAKYREQLGIPVARLRKEM